MDDKTTRGKDRSIVVAAGHVATAEALLAEAQKATNDQAELAFALRAVGHLMLARALQDEWR